MEYNEFIKYICQEIKEKLDPEAVVSTNCTVKNNHTLKYSMTILYPGENTSPAIYLDYFYKKYRSGMSTDQIAEEILLLYNNNKTSGMTDIRTYLDFEYVKSKIFCKLVNYEKNLPELYRVPHRQFLDLAVVYYCEMEHESFGLGTILIQNAHLQFWDIDCEVLHRLAVTNTCQENPHVFVEMSDLVKSMTGVEMEEYLELVPMYVLTNRKKIFGAASIYFPEVLDEISDQIDSDFYVLPSSIHECMIVPVTDKTQMKAGDYQEMVEEINRDFVSGEEILGESVYRYFRERKELCIVAGHTEETYAQIN